MESTVNIVIAVILAYVAIRGVTASIVGSLRHARRMREHYYVMPFHDREVMIKAIFYTLDKRGPLSSRDVADALDLNPYTADEAIFRLSRRGYLISGPSSGAFFSELSMIPRTELSEQGREFFEDFYDSSGDTINVAPWGTLVNRTTLGDNSSFSQQTFASGPAAGAWSPAPATSQDGSARASERMVWPEEEAAPQARAYPDPVPQPHAPQPDTPKPYAPQSRRPSQAVPAALASPAAREETGRRVSTIGAGLCVVSLAVSLIGVLVSDGAYQPSLAEGLGVVNWLGVPALFVALAVFAVRGRGSQRLPWRYAVMGAAAWPVINFLAMWSTLSAYEQSWYSLGVMGFFVLLSAGSLGLGAGALVVGLAWMNGMRVLGSVPALVAVGLAALHGLLLDRQVVWDLYGWPALLTWLTLTSLVFLISSTRSASLPFTIGGWAIFAFAGAVFSLGGWYPLPVQRTFELTRFLVPLAMLALAYALRRRPQVLALGAIDLREAGSWAGRRIDRLSDSQK